MNWSGFQLLCCIIFCVFSVRISNVNWSTVKPSQCFRINAAPARLLAAFELALNSDTSAVTGLSPYRVVEMQQYQLNSQGFQLVEIISAGDIIVAGGTRR
jgi:hypothetical protein